MDMDPYEAVSEEILPARRQTREPSEAEIKVRVAARPGQF
jgi:hypothetical protein